MAGQKARFVKIKIVNDGKKIINLTIPLFLFSAIIFLIPGKLLNKWINQELDVKEMYYQLKKQGRGTKININDEQEQIKIELK